MTVAEAAFFSAAEGSTCVAAAAPESAEGRYREVGEKTNGVKRRDYEKDAVRITGGHSLL